MNTVNSKRMIPNTAASRPRVRITDTTLRDAHQSLWATRMRTDDILAIADKVDKGGYYSLECWGGATFDVCLRFLRENPWERLRQLKAVCKKTPLQMLLRGQNILGYKNYPDDVLERFIALSCENGVDIFRIFDALNDTRNLENAIRAVKKYGGHAQGTICYTYSPVHTVENFVAIAKEQESMGIDTLCIKDMAGILSPAAATALVSALVRSLKVPVQVHSHMTSGMAVAMYLSAVKAGAGAIDTAVSTMSGFSSQPPTETLVAILEDEGYDTGLDHAMVAKANSHFKALKKVREPSSGLMESVDADVLEHHIPGGMISNLRSQLQQQGALNRLSEVLEELPQTRKDMGYPPLVTPTSQIVGVQAVLNVLAGKRYEMVTQETRDYVKGLYGRSPAPINPKLAKSILKGEKRVTCRPADLLKPGLADAAAQVDSKLIEKEEDILSYCLFPEVALSYFKWRSAPADQRDPIPADTEGAGAQKKTEPPTTADALRTAPTVSGEVLKYAEIGKLVTALAGRLGGGAGVAALVPETVTPAEPVKDTDHLSPEKAPEKKTDEPPLNGVTVLAPLNGTFYRSPGPGKPELASEGDSLKEGDPLCIVEAMKLFNQIKADKPLKVLKFLVSHGAVVTKGQPLVLVQHPGV
ncbi:MAG: pyruvate carboxylase subunit B [Kiritimatiellae bacterium]|nr:pyruvate carboxylase subunit B [Kiritimatiellia bacterium]